MRPRLLLTINCKFAVDFFARGLHTCTAVTRLPLRQLGFLVFTCIVCTYALMTITTYLQSHQYKEKLIDEFHCCPSSVVSLSDLMTPVGHPLSFWLQIATSETIRQLHSFSWFILLNLTTVVFCSNAVIVQF